MFIQFLQIYGIFRHQRIKNLTHVHFVIWVWFSGFCILVKLYKRLSVFISSLFFYLGRRWITVKIVDEYYISNRQSVLQMDVIDACNKQMHGCIDNIICQLRTRKLYIAFINQRKLHGAIGISLCPAVFKKPRD